MPVISSSIPDLRIWHGEHVVNQLGSLIRLIDAATCVFWEWLDSLSPIYLLFLHSSLFILNCKWNLARILRVRTSLFFLASVFLPRLAYCLTHNRCSLNLSEILFSLCHAFPSTKLESFHGEGARGCTKTIFDEDRTRVQVSALLGFCSCKPTAYMDMLRMGSTKLPSGNHMVTLFCQVDIQVLTAWHCYLCQHRTKYLYRCLHLTSVHYNEPFLEMEKFLVAWGQGC